MTDRSRTAVPEQLISESGVVARPGFAFAALAIIQLTLVASITMLSLALPAVQREFHVGIGDLALASSAYGLSFSGLLLLGGRFADLCGRRTSLAVAATLFSMGSLLGMLSPNIPVLVAARFIQGCGAAFGAPAAMALVSQVFPTGQRRNRALAAWGALASVGAVAGTLLGGAAVTWHSWRLMFGVVGIVMLAGVGVVWRLLPAPRPTGRQGWQVDVPGAVLVTAGLTAASYGLIAATNNSWGSPVVVTSLSAGAVLLVIFARWETHAQHPLLPLALFNSARRLAALSIMLVTSASLSATFFFLSLYFQQILNYSALQTSAAFLPLGIILVIAGAVSGGFLARAGNRIVAVTGLILVAIGLFLIGRLSAEGGYIGPLLAGLLVLPAGACFSFAGATVTAVSEAPDEQAGLVSGVLNAAMETGPTIGLAALVAIAGTHATAASSSTHSVQAAGYGLALTVAGAAVAVVGIVAAMTLQRKSRGPVVSEKPSWQQNTGD